MAVKRRLGKLPLPESVASYVGRRLASDDVRPLPVGVDHAAGVETLELLHKDPLIGSLLSRQDTRACDY